MPTSRSRTELAIHPLYQGQSNGCGTTALAMSLNVLTGQSGWTQSRLDAGHRVFNSFSSPELLCQLARAAGAHAIIHNQTDWPRIVAELDAGHPLIALLTINGRVDGLHYMVIGGYEQDPIQDTRQLILYDPASDQHPRRVLDYSLFCRQLWRPLTFWGIPLGFSQCAILFSDTAPSSPPSVPWSLALAHQVNRLLQVLHRLIHLTD